MLIAERTAEVLDNDAGQLAALHVHSVSAADLAALDCDTRALLVKVLDAWLADLDDARAIAHTALAKLKGLKDV